LSDPCAGHADRRYTRDRARHAAGVAEAGALTRDHHPFYPQVYTVKHYVVVTLEDAKTFVVRLGEGFSGEGPREPVLVECASAEECAAWVAALTASGAQHK
jgi:hypothetical protein